MLGRIGPGSSARVTAGCTLFGGHHCHPSLPWSSEAVRAPPSPVMWLPQVGSSTPQILSSFAIRWPAGVVEWWKFDPVKISSKWDSRDSNFGLGAGQHEQWDTSEHGLLSAAASSIAQGFLSVCYWQKKLEVLDKKWEVGVGGGLTGCIIDWWANSVVGTVRLLLDTTSSHFSLLLRWCWVLHSVERFNKSLISTFWTQLLSYS